MIEIKNFAYKPEEYEAEKASNNYVMSLLAGIGGLPFPLINLVATVIFYVANRKSTYFVRWHCTQALLSQFTLFIINTVTFVWSLLILFTDIALSNEYIAYVIAALLVNLSELIMTIHAAVITRKGMHVEWWFWGPVTDRLVSREPRPVCNTH